MKKIILLPLLLIFILIFTTTKTLAHFGSKGPFGGSVSCSSVYDSTVYIGTFTGGVYQSTNAQLISWQPISVGLKSGKISALTHSGAYLFAGTMDSGVYIFNGYVGTDKYWVKINNGLTNLKIKSLFAIDSITILAGTDGSGLFKTTNKGSTWTPVNSMSLNNASISGFTKAGNKIIALSFSDGVFASNDNGNTWTSFNDTGTATAGGTVGVSYNAATDQLSVVDRNGICITDGVSNTTTPFYYSINSILPAGVQIRSVINNGKTWFLGTDSGVFSSTASTINWLSVNPGLPTTDVTNVIPFKTNLLVGTNKEGIFKSDTTSIAWKDNNNGFNNLATYAMETSGNQTVVVATEKGVFVSKDLENTYTRANKGLTDSLNVTSLKFLGSMLYAGTKNAGVFVSADTGRTWTASISGLIILNIKKIFASNTNWYVLDSTGKLFQLIGLTWASLQNGLPTGVLPTSMSFYGTKMLLGTLGQGVFTKEVSSGSWTSINAGLSDYNITSVTNNGIKLFAGTNGSGVFSADIVAPNWKQTSPTSILQTVSTGLDGTKIQAMAYNAGYIFASYRGGLLATADSGKTWIAAGNQFNLPSYVDLNQINFVTTRVFVSTPTNSLYSNALSELPTIISGVNDISPELNTAIEISPNPSNGNFIISLKDAEIKINEVLLYNNTGRLLQRLQVNYELQIANYELHLYNYPVGIYFLRVNTDKGIAVKKIVIE